MLGVLQSMLDAPLPDGLIPSSARSWLSHSIDSEHVNRHVRRRQGDVSTTSTPQSRSGRHLGADFDLAWMRSSIPPAMPLVGPSLAIADLFAGCGGMSLGMREAARAIGLGCRFSFASELDPVKGKIYAANLDPAQVHFGAVETLIDGTVGAAATQFERELLRKLDPIDILLGGPPCQGHSDLNNHTRRDDVRNSLIGRMVRFAELVEPSLIVIENVEGVRHDRRGSAAQAAKQLQAMGYHVVESTLKCAQLGVPQSRRRYVLVAARQDITRAIEEFEAIDLGERSVSWAIEDLLSIESDATFDTSAVHAVANQRRMRYLFDNDLYDLPDAERPDCHRLKPHSYRGVYGRMRWDKPAPTITTGFGSTGQGRFVHPKRVRTLTPHEAARLQTYPDFFDFGTPGRTQLQKMIGNSVPPLAMAMLGMALLR